MKKIRGSYRSVCRSRAGKSVFILLCCILPLVLTACHIEAGRPGTNGSDTETTGQESSGREDIPADNTLPQNQDDVREGTDTIANTPDTEMDTGHMEDEEASYLEADYILPDSNSRLYSREELEALTREEIKLARNEIYARHGRQFKDKALQEYFESRTWYQGTVESDKFDDAQLSRTEHDNLSLLIRLEQDKKDLPENGKETGEQDDNRFDDPITIGYTDIVKTNQYRKLYLSTEERFSDNDQVRSQIIDRGSFFEVTHGCIFADTCYDLSVMDGKGVGDILKLENSEYRITEVNVWDLDNGENVQLEYVSGTDGAHFEGYYMLVRNYKDNYYTLMGENANTHKDTLYTGSLYFSKDCITTAKDPDNQFEDHTVSISAYLTKDRKKVRSQFGLYPSVGFDLWGDFKIDSSGYIIVYTEYFVP